MDHGDWRVTISFPDRLQAERAKLLFPRHKVADEARREGRQVIRRWKFLVIPADDEDEAQELAKQVSREAPADATVRAEHTPVLLPFIGW